jgi:hypothetical protein
MDKNVPYESLSDVREKLEKDKPFYDIVSSLCLLAVKGYSSEVRNNAKKQLEDFLNPAFDVVPVTTDNMTSIYLTHIAKAEDIWILSIQPHYVAFSDINGVVHIESTN